MDLIRYSDDQTSREITMELKLLSLNKMARAKRSEKQALMDELATLRDFFRSAKAKSEEDNLWLVQLMEVAEMIENLHRASEQRQWTTFLRRASSWLIGAINSPCDQATKLQIQSFTVLLREINRRGQMYKQLSHKINDDVLGLDLQSGELVRRLMGRESRSSVILVVGIGGAGKTTLTRKVFTDSEVRRCLDCVIWILASRFDDLKDSMIEALRSTLPSNVRYINFWQQMKLPLPDEDNGSQVLVTTGDQQIFVYGSKMSFGHVYDVKPLSFEDCLVLFCSRAFGSGSCPHRDLENMMSSEFVWKCHGWPIAIVASAGEKVLHVVNPGPRIIGNLLGPIFKSPPYNPKLCFLYFGLFPENYVFKISRLYKLWIAEGFIEQKYRRQTLEEVAENYLDELFPGPLVMQEPKGYSEVFNSIPKMRQKFDFHGYPLDQNTYQAKESRIGSHGSVRNIIIAFWRYLRLSFSHSMDNVSRGISSSNNRLIKDDGVGIVSQGSPSSDRCLSDYDLKT